MEFIIDPNKPAPQRKQADGGGGGRGASAPAGGDGDIVRDSTTARFMSDVIEASMKVPVIVDFWAPWCGPCKQLGPLIERLVRQAGGLVRLVKINVDENQELAAQLRVQSIPAVYAFHRGRPVDGFVGALPESQIKSFIDRLLGGAKAPLDEALDHAKQALDAGQFDDAAEIFAAIREQEPAHAGATAGLLRALLGKRDVAGAKKLAAGLAPELRRNGEVSAALAGLELVEQGAGAAGIDRGALEARIAADPKDHQARLDLAIAQFANGRPESAIEQLLESVRRDREWNEQAARKQLIKIFDALGPGHELTVGGRRKLSSILFS